MKRFILILAALAVVVTTFAARPVVIDLWPDGAPNSSGLDRSAQKEDPSWATGVVDAKLRVYRASKPNGVAIIAMPGGAYQGLAMDYEGTDMARWMNRLGITFCVLQYRMPEGHREVPLSDVRRALEIVRDSATNWKVNPAKVGVMGSSAGGHLAATASNLWENAAQRPDFQILLYPVITMEEGVTHEVSAQKLLGAHATRADRRAWSMETRVQPSTPEAFIAVSADDATVPLENSLRYASALSAAKVPYELHVYPTGGHGWGYDDGFLYYPQWTAELESWLRNRVIL